MHDAFPLINRPDKQSPARRWGFRIATTLAWVIWLYLWLPAVTLFAWAMGVRIAGQVLFNDADRHYLQTLGTYGVWVAVIALVFMLWSGYNTRRFRGRNRSGRSQSADASTVASDLQLSTEAVASIMNSRKVTIEFDELGRPAGALIKIRGEERTVEVH